MYDQDIEELTAQYNQARESRDFQINDGVNRDGSMGPKARAFQAAMDKISVNIEKKREEKRLLQAESSAALLKFQQESMSELTDANVELAETQSDMRGHMPVIRYFLPNKDHQRNVVLWGLGLFAAVISLTGPLISYALAIHLNHKRKHKDDDSSNDGNKTTAPTIFLDIEEDIKSETSTLSTVKVDDSVAKFMAKRRMGYL